MQGPRLYSLTILLPSYFAAFYENRLVSVNSLFSLQSLLNRR